MGFHPWIYGNIGDTRTEILMNVRDRNKYALELRRQVKAITPKSSHEPPKKRHRQSSGTEKKTQNNAKNSTKSHASKAKQGKNSKK